MLLIVLANVLGLLVGFMLGVLIRNSAGAIVAYFVYSLVLPSIFGILAEAHGWAIPAPTPAMAEPTTLPIAPIANASSIEATATMIDAIALAQMT